MSTNNIDLRILFEDAHFLAVDKPAGVPSQPDLTGDPSMLERIAALQETSGLGPAHRLDRPVSGVLLFGRSEMALRALNGLFRERTVQKTYWAIVEGIAPEQGRCSALLERSARGRKAVTRQAQSAKEQSHLEFRRLAQGDRFALLEVRPEGGGFHQIRALLAAEGLPIKGDVKYGARRGEPDRSIALHARSLAFQHPFRGTPVRIEAPEPVRSIWPALLALR
ncbi:MAG TPA: RluA family pseudouridine synthase [Flavobacteriales bacterium]